MSGASQASCGSSTDSHIKSPLCEKLVAILFEFNLSSLWIKHILNWSSSSGVHASQWGGARVGVSELYIGPLTLQEVFRCCYILGGHTFIRMSKELKTQKQFYRNTFKKNFFFYENLYKCRIKHRQQKTPTKQKYDIVNCYQVKRLWPPFRSGNAPLPATQQHLRVLRPVTALSLFQK